MSSTKNRNEHEPPLSERTKRRPASGIRRELEKLKEDNSKRAKHDTVKCPVCHYRIDTKYWAEHYNYELHILAEPTSDAYNDPLNQNKGKRGAAVMARKQLERSVGKKKTHSIYEDTFNRIQRNKEKRMELLKRMDDSKLEESTSSLDSEIALQTYLDTPDVQTCFICNEQLYGDLEAINLHIDNCLSNPSPTHNEPATTIMPTVSTSSPPSDDWQEYEWAGHRRVRATAMMEGGYGGAGFATTSKKEEEEGEEEDLDVEDDDAAQYGESQYTERDIVVDMDDENEDESALREMVSGGSIRTAISDRERDEFEEAVSIAGWNQHLNNESTNIKSKEDHSRLIIDSLKARIHELELNRSAHQCLICLEPYKTPVTSIICWHVHCEQCWLQTLGSKKLCPQCQKITTPSDLRRVYL